MNKLTKMLSFSSRNSYGHTTSAIRSDIIHKRVKPVSERNELDIVRYPRGDYKVEDVDTVTHENNSQVVI